jgi:hypothetical protein
MHAPPAFQFTVQHLSLWRLALAILSLLVSSSLLVWVFAFSAASGPFTSLWLLGLFSVVAVMVLCIMPLWRTATCSLRWDTQAWHWGPPNTRGYEPQTGAVDVALDLGPWLLLRLTPSSLLQSNRLRHKVQWLPVQRLGHEAAWHALRATLYGVVGPEQAHAKITPL